ncbi:MAG: type II secretion system protein GspD [Longimicrobiales bacterium]
MNRNVATSMLVVSLVLSARPAHAVVQQQQGIRTTQGGIILNFQDVDLAYVISALAQAAQLNVVYSDLPAKQVTLRTSEAVSRENVEGLIRDLAAAHGVTVTEQNGFIRLQGGAQEGAEVPRQLYILRLRHARAPVLAQTLQSLFGGAVIQARSPEQAATLSQQLRIMEQQTAMMRQQAAQNQQFMMPAVRFGELEGNVTIVPDEITNSLLVRATAADWLVIQQAIQSLDLRPLQVVIEVVIAEVRRTDELNVGVGFSAVKEDSRGETGISLPGEIREDAFTLDILRTGDIDIEATLSALASTGNVRILSRPVILAQNNQEARILVGSQRPFVQVSRSLPTDQVQFDQVVQYQSVGTSLTILPTINDDGYVNLAVTQEVSSATDEVQFDAPVISTREAATQLLARNGQTVVIGGLVDRQTEHVRTGIPFLKDIPLIGFLFGSTRETTGNSELFLFLTPYIVATDEDAETLRREIENRSELLQSIVPIKPILPPVVRTIRDTIRSEVR